MLAEIGLLQTHQRTHHIYLNNINKDIKLIQYFEFFPQGQFKFLVLTEGGGHPKMFLHTDGVIYNNTIKVYALMSPVSGDNKSNRWAWTSRIRVAHLHSVSCLLVYVELLSPSPVSFPALSSRLPVCPGCARHQGGMKGGHYEAGLAQRLWGY